MVDTKETAFLDLNVRDISNVLAPVRIGESTYQLLKPTSLGIEGMAILGTFQEQIQATLDRLAAKPSDKDALSEFKSCFTSLVQLLMPDCPQAEIAGLEDWQQVKLLSFLTESRSLPRPRATPPVSKHANGKKSR